MAHGVYICDSAQEDNLLTILIIIQTEASTWSGPPGQ